MKIIVFFTSRWRRITSSCMSRRISGSSALNGSSNSMISGSVASARARPTRCCIPPESSSGYASPQLAEPDRAEHLVARCASALVLLDALHLEPERDVVHDAPVRQQPEVLEHHADLAATDLAQPLVVERQDVLAVDQHLAGGRLEQPGDASAPASTCPLPDSPITTKTSPGATSKETSRTAATHPVFSSSSAARQRRPRATRRSSRPSVRRPSRRCGRRPMTSEPSTRATPLPLEPDRRIVGPRADARKAGVAASATLGEQTARRLGHTTAPWRLRDTTS